MSQALYLAKQIAKIHGMFISEVTEATGPAWVVYRKAAYDGARATRLGRRSTPDELLRYVKRLAGVDQATKTT